MYRSQDVAKRIKQTAKERDVSIRQMLSEIGLGLNTMANMKTSMPKADNLAKIADYLQTSVDYLLGRTDVAAPPQKMLVYPLTEYSHLPLRVAEPTLSEKERVKTENTTTENL